MLTRRQLIRSGAAVAVLAPQTQLTAFAAPRGRASKLLRGGTFPQGVMSGDPTPNGITLSLWLCTTDQTSGRASYSAPWMNRSR